MNKNLKYILIFIFLNNIISVKFKENGLKILKHIDNNSIKYQYLFGLGIPLFNKYFLKKIKKIKKNEKKFENNLIDQESIDKVNKFGLFLINYSKEKEIQKFCNQTDYLKTLLIVNNGNNKEQGEIVKNLKEKVDYSIDIDIDLFLNNKLNELFIYNFNPIDLNILIQEKLDELRQEKRENPNSQSILYIKNLEKVICNRDLEYKEKNPVYYKINTVLNLLTIIDGLKYEKDGITLIISLDYEYEDIIDLALFRWGRFFEKVYILKKENNYKEVLKKEINKEIEELKKNYYGKDTLKYVKSRSFIGNYKEEEMKKEKGFGEDTYETKYNEPIYDKYTDKLINFKFISYKKDIKTLKDERNEFHNEKELNKEQSELNKFDIFIEKFEDIVKKRHNLFIIEKYKKRNLINNIQEK